MIALLSMMASVLLLWVGFFVVFTGLGLLLSQLFGNLIQDSEDLLHSFWVGWALSIFILQLWHIQFPVDWKAIALLSLMGMIYLFWAGPTLWNLFRKNLPKNWALLLLLLLVSFWLANRTIGSGRLYDTGLYHLPSVHWIKAFPIVPGLGNLHGRLAFNSSYFLYPALLESGPWSIRSQHLSGGFLLLVLFTQILVSANRIFTAKKKEKTHHLFMIMMLTPVLIMAFGQHVSSLSPDLPVFILGVVVSTKLLELMEKPEQAPKSKEYALLTTVLLVTLGITIKLSFLLFGLFASMVAASVTFFRKGKRKHVPTKKTFIWVMVPVVIILFTWMVRGVILSGYLFYPSTTGSFSLEWRIPRQAAIEEANWVRSWARRPNVHWSEVLGNWDWLKPWALRMLKNYQAIAPTAMILVGCFFILFSSLMKLKAQNRQRRKWLFLLPSITSLFYWFFTAPDLRLAGASFWILGAGAMTLAVCTYLRRKTIWIAGLSLALLCSWLILEKVPIKEKIFFKKIYPSQYAELEKFKTRSGLILFVPKKGDQCWNGPLLCTPFPKVDLRLRQEGDISKGFKLDSKD